MSKEFKTGSLVAYNNIIGFLVYNSPNDWTVCWCGHEYPDSRPPTFGEGSLRRWKKDFKLLKKSLEK